MSKASPVVITGAGPVGLVTALRLERAGVPCIVLEKSPTVQDDLRASTFHPPTLEMLDQFGLTGKLLQQGLVTPDWQIRMHESGERALFDLGVIADETPYPFRLQVEQRVLCELATELIADLPDVDLRMGHELMAFSQNGDGVSLTVQAADGETYLIETPYLIAADGASSFVRKSMDLPFEGLTYPETTILATTEFPFHEHLEGLSNVNYIWFDQGTFSLLKLPGVWRCSLYAAPEQSIEDALQPDNIEAHMQRIVPREQRYEVLEIRPYRIHQRILDEYVHGRILFVGDAAHMNSPSGGMGMNGGIHDAWSLTEHLPPVLRGDTAYDQLFRYTRQRQPVAKEAILQQAHKNRTRMQERDSHKRQQELARLQGIADDAARAKEFLLNSSMITGLRRSRAID